MAIEMTANQACPSFLSPPSDLQGVNTALCLSIQAKMR